MILLPNGAKVRRTEEEWFFTPVGGEEGRVSEVVAHAAIGHTYEEDATEETQWVLHPAGPTGVSVLYLGTAEPEPEPVESNPVESGEFRLIKDVPPEDVIFLFSGPQAGRIIKGSSDLTDADLDSLGVEVRAAVFAEKYRQEGLWMVAPSGQPKVWRVGDWCEVRGGDAPCLIIDLDRKAGTYRVASAWSSRNAVSAAYKVLVVTEQEIREPMADGPYDEQMRADFGFIPKPGRRSRS
jgi:hypothetical protein